jgi:glyoxylase-like metal-dependent hydrolase (beta-lactamase superfamily II)
LFNREEGLLLSGDQILPTISTVIRFPKDVEDDPLRQYLESITRLKELNPAKIMPAHGEPFTDMNARIEQLLHHHRERLQLIMDCMNDKPCSARTIVDHLFGKLDAFNLFLASGEISAHLLLLRSQGKVQISQDPQSGQLGFALV